MKQYVIGFCVMVATTAFAEGSHGWNLTVGPAWRTRVKSSISASHTGLTPSQTVTVDKDVAGQTSWSEGDVVVVQDPDYSDDPTMTKYAATQTKTETIVTPGGASGIGDSDTDRPLGIKANLGYDFQVTERFSVGLNLKFATYWKMRTSASGIVGGGTMTVRETTDYYLFSNGPMPDDTDFEFCYPDATPYDPYQNTKETMTAIPGNYMSARIRSDLYQVGLGPQATWHIAPWLTAYGRLEALCNFADLEVDSTFSSDSSVKCLWGVGGALGLTASLTDNLGVYAEAGYEWIDKSETDLGGARVEVDYSSLVISAGLVYWF